MKQEKSCKKLQPNEFIKAIRESFIDSVIVYTCGGCFGFYKILKCVFKNAEAYVTEDKKHIITKIDGHFYDIRGCADDDKEGNLKLPQSELEWWDGHTYGQRFERMYKKYKKF